MFNLFCKGIAIAVATAAPAAEFCADDANPFHCPTLDSLAQQVGAVVTQFSLASWGVEELIVKWLSSREYYFATEELQGWEDVLRTLYGDCIKGEVTLPEGDDAFSPLILPSSPFLRMEIKSLNEMQTLFLTRGVPFASENAALSSMREEAQKGTYFYVPSLRFEAIAEKLELSSILAHLKPKYIAVESEEFFNQLESLLQSEENLINTMKSEVKRRWFTTGYRGCLKMVMENFGGIAGLYLAGEVTGNTENLRLQAEAVRAAMLTRLTKSQIPFWLYDRDAAVERLRLVEINVGPPKEFSTLEGIRGFFAARYGIGRHYKGLCGSEILQRVYNHRVRQWMWSLVHGTAGISEEEPPLWAVNAFNSYESNKIWLPTPLLWNPFAAAFRLLVGHELAHAILPAPETVNPVCRHAISQIESEQLTDLVGFEAAVEVSGDALQEFDAFTTVWCAGYPSKEFESSYPMNDRHPAERKRVTAVLRHSTTLRQALNCDQSGDDCRVW